MKKLSDADINDMANAVFKPDTNVAKQVRSELRLSTRLPQTKPAQYTERAVLDLHQYTQEQAWDAINNLIHSGIRNATIITGASGILKIKFQQWVKDSIISAYFISVTPINNGSFCVRLKKPAD